MTVSVPQSLRRIVDQNIIETRKVSNDRIVELAFSSEIPVERFFGFEVLDHSPSSIRLDWISSGRAPLLLNHDQDIQIGVVESITIGRDLVGRARVRFGKGERPSEILNDIRDGIRLNVSIGYKIHKLERDENVDGRDAMRVTDWEPLEISIVSLPADSSVGVGRSEPNPITRSNTMNTNTTMDEPENVPDAIKKDDGQRIREINAIGKAHNLRDLADQHIERGTPVKAFQKFVLDEVSERSGNPVTLYQEGEIDRKFRSEAIEGSLTRAVRSIVENGHLDGREREISDELTRRHGRKPEGFYIAPSSLQKRTSMTTTSGSLGGYTVPTDHRGDLMIDILSNVSKVRDLGATILRNLQGDISIPKLTQSTTAEWVSEGSAANESNLTFGALAMSPKQVTGLVHYTRKLLLQSDPSIEDLVNRDLTRQIGLAVDQAAISGTGSSNQPAGILSTTGIGDVSGGTDGLLPAWSHIVALESEVAAANADMGALGYLTNAYVRGILKETTKVSSDAGAGFIWEPGNEPGFDSLNGYRAAVSNQVPSNLDKGSSTDVCSAIIFGNWSDLIIAEFGAIDIIVDPYTYASTGNIRIAAHYFCDIGVRHADSFAAMQDTLTA